MGSRGEAVQVTQMRQHRLAPSPAWEPRSRLDVLR
jgi:hypothetical protein